MKEIKFTILFYPSNEKLIELNSRYITHIVVALSSFAITLANSALLILKRLALFAPGQSTYAVKSKR